MRLNFKRLGLLCGRAARALARQMGLTTARVDLLAILLRHEVAQVDLAAILCVTEPVVSVMVRALEEQGWLQRRHPPGNRRVNLCSLTPLGRTRLEPHLNDEVSIDSDGKFGAQCTGEAMWIVNDWETELLASGLDVTPVLRIEKTELLLFRAMQAWNKHFDYRRFFAGGDHGYGREFWTSTFVEAQVQRHTARDLR